MKRHRPHCKFNKKKDTWKNRRVREEVVRSPSPEDSVSSEEIRSEVESEGVVYKEPTLYDKLLVSLSSSNKVVADVNKRRLRQEEGKSDTEEEDGDMEEEEEDENDDSQSEYSSISDDEDNEIQGADKDLTEESRMQENQSEDSEDSESDDKHELSSADQSATDASLYPSAFGDHLGHKLSGEDVENLPKCKWKFNWESLAIDMPNCKWKGTGEKNFMDGFQAYANYDLKPKLYKHWLELYKRSGGKDFDSSKRRRFFSLCNSYRDILHSNKKPFYNKGLEEDSSTMEAYLMHSLNHIFKTRDLVKKNEAKIAKHQETAAEDVLYDNRFLDQGFTRPKVLILLPMRSIAFRVVKRLIQLTPPSQRVNVEHLDRFQAEFGTEEETDVNDMNNNTSENGIPKSQKSSKPSDFQSLFGGNCDDEFMIGIKFTRKSIRLYGDFYSSDIIIASPLKLHMAIGQAEEDKERDVDYLSSIEVLIIDHADIISMQNWTFLSTVVDHLNRIPSKQHGTNVMRIRQWYLDGHSKFYRQSIVLSSYLTPEMNALFNHSCVNYKGKLKLACEHKGVLQKVLLPVRQICERFTADSIIQADDARFDYFTKKIFPKIKDSIEGGIMIFVHSYFEFVRLRNFLKSQNASFCLLGDYTKPADISRARVWFFEGKRKIMLYTERAYFYRRYKIRGIKNLMFYSLPERKEFYPELVNMLEGSHDMTSTLLFSRFDLLRLERIVGCASAKRMINSDKNIFAFC